MIDNDSPVPLSLILRRTVVRVLDRAGLRWLLGGLLTAYARSFGHRGVRVRFDGQDWIRQAESGELLVDGPTFCYEALDMQEFTRRFFDYREIARESWMPLYTPGPGDVVIDIGAGVGTDTLAFAELVGPTGRVIAIEASPPTAARLRKMVRLNRLSQVTVIDRALLACAGTVAMESSTSHLENRVVLGAASKRHLVQVSGNSLDELCAEFAITRIDLLKANIEGAERLLLQGMSHSLPLVRHAAIAAHDFLWRATGDEWFRTQALVTNFLEEHGFQVLVRPELPNESDRDIVCGSRPV